MYKEKFIWTGAFQPWEPKPQLVQMSILTISFHGDLSIYTVWRSGLTPVFRHLNKYSDYQKSQRLPFPIDFWLRNLEHEASCLGIQMWNGAPTLRKYVGPSFLVSVIKSGSKCPYRWETPLQTRYLDTEEEEGNLLASACSCSSFPKSREQESSWRQLLQSALCL